MNDRNHASHLEQRLGVLVEVDKVEVHTLELVDEKKGERREKGRKRLVRAPWLGRRGGI